MGDNGSIWLPEAGSALASEVDALFWFVFWVSTLIFAGVVAAIIYYATKYRRRDPSFVPEPAHESKFVEAAWIVGPTILVLIVFTWGANVFIKLNTAPPDSYNIQATGKQWVWEYSYPNGIQTAGDLVVPVGRPVKLTLSSTDVLHSYFVPAFRVKMDAVPNRYTSIWFEAEEVGEYQVYCTEYCGTAHSGMTSKVVAVSEEDFQRWLQEQNADLPPVELGQREFEARCQVCHSVDGERKVGPPLNGLFGTERTFVDADPVVADENYLRESIVNPMVKIVEGYPPGMPPFANLPAETINGLVEYIKSLEDQ